jgi:uncharacterized protein (TIGR04222 family)
MKELLHTIETMPGPQFLLLYVVILAGTLLVCRLALRRLDTTPTDPPPPIPSEPDAFELAYLRGGARELIRLVTIELVERGDLKVTDRDGGQFAASRPLPDSLDLTPIERRVFQWFADGRNVRDALGSGGLHDEVEGMCARYRERLEREQLLTPEPARWAARAVGLAVLVFLGTLAGYKLTVAVPAHRPVQLLIHGALATIVLTCLACKLPRLSRRGREYLRRLQLAYGKIALPSTRSPIGEVQPVLLLLVGLFGIATLADTAYAHYAQPFPKAAGTSWSLGGDGDGCGSCGSCGGCGGCGDD